MSTIALNKIVAVEKGVKAQTYKRFTALHKQTMSQLISGLNRSYEPKAEDGDRFPSEDKHLQVRVPEVLDEAQKLLTRLFDVVATKDYGNTEARADLKVDGVVLIPEVPVTYLLFLEKQLSDIKTFVDKLPVLDPAEKWDWNEDQMCYATPPVETQREKKVPRILVKAPATKEHKEQVDVWMDTEVAGYWTLVKFSGAISVARRKELQDRVEALQEAVKFAREEANTTEVTDKKFGKDVLNWLFA